jgi:4-amino-4-deoxy-L-arabinose transferase-like glycosyltransferase
MIKAIKANLYFISLFLLLVLFIIIKIPYLNLPYYWDEAWVYGPALRIMEANHLSIMPDSLPVYFSRGHPLLFHFIGTSWLRIFGTSLLSSHIFALTVSIALLLMVYYFCKEFFSQKIGLIACFFIMLQPIFQAQSVLVLPEIMLALFSLMTIFYFLKGKWIGYITAATCALYIKETGIIAIAAVGFWFLINQFFVKKEKINLSQFILRSFILLIPILLFCIFLIIQKKSNGWYFFPEHIGSIISDPLIVFKNLIKQANYVLFYDGRIMLFAGMILSLYFYFSRKKYHDNPSNVPLILLLIFSVFYLLISAVCFYSNRYSISIIIPFIITASFFVAEIFTKKTYLFTFIIVFFILQVTINYTYSISSDCNLGYKEDIKTNMQMVKFCVDNKYQNKKIYTNFLMATELSNPYSGYLSEQQKFSNFGSIIDTNTEFFIFSNMEQLKENKEQIENYKKIKSSKGFRLLKRYESKFSWTEIYETLKP